MSRHVFVLNQTISCIDTNTTEEVTSLQEENKPTNSDTILPPELNPMMHTGPGTCRLHVGHLTPPPPPPLGSYLQQFVEVFDVTFLHLLGRDLRLFEMDVLVVKCLEEAETQTQGSSLEVNHKVNTCYCER